MNAKEELSHFAFGDIKCAFIVKSDGFRAFMHMTERADPDAHKADHEARLKVGHTEEEFKAFMNALDFEYDNGYGGQELYGMIWLTNGTWLDRGEYDGSEWWQHHSLPEIPADLK